MEHEREHDDAICIERPSLADFEAIDEVFYKTWLATYPNAEHGISRTAIESLFQQHSDAESVERRRRLFANMPDNKLMLVARTQGKIVATAIFSRSSALNEIEIIYVLPSYQSQGIGKRLWGSAIEHFFDLRNDVVVEVVTYNQKAISYYGRLGFVDTCERLAKITLPDGKEIPEMRMRLAAGMISACD